MNSFGYPNLSYVEIVDTNVSVAMILEDIQ